MQERVGAEFDAESFRTGSLQILSRRRGGKMRRMLTLMLTTALASAALLGALKTRKAEAQQGSGDARHVREETATDEHAPRPLRPAHTFSIVARDPETGELGVAVQSHWFSVGSNVAWGEAGVGAGGTQALLRPSLGRG